MVPFPVPLHYIHLPSLPYRITYHWYLDDALCRCIVERVYRPRAPLSGIGQHPPISASIPTPPPLLLSLLLSTCHPLLACNKFAWNTARISHSVVPAEFPDEDSIFGELSLMIRARTHSRTRILASSQHEVTCLLLLNSSPAPDTV